MIQLQAKIATLCAQNAVPQQKKLDLHIKKFERMKRFYDSKIPIAPDEQAEMFTEFSEALAYGISTLVKYRKLTVGLAELTEGEDETRTNS